MRLEREIDPVYPVVTVFTHMVGQCPTFRWTLVTPTQVIVYETSLN